MELLEKTFVKFLLTIFIIGIIITIFTTIYIKTKQNKQNKIIKNEINNTIGENTDIYKNFFFHAEGI